MTIAKRLYLLIALAVASAAILSGMSFIQIERVYRAANYANYNMGRGRMPSSDSGRPGNA